MQSNNIHPASALQWSEWLPHQGCWKDTRVPKLPGLYRIRRVDADGLEYLGQTGGGCSNLRKRLGAQIGIYRDEMPHTDPHTAAPGLWALRQEFRAEFEVSTAVVQESDPVRKGVEAWVIAMHRQEHGRSPSINFGRILAGFKKSSGVSRKLASAGKQFRGGRCDTIEKHHAPGIGPAGPLGGDPHGDNWSGHRWSAWTDIGSAYQQMHAQKKGLYRIRGKHQAPLTYVGEGLVASRLHQHHLAAMNGEDSKAQAFRDSGELEASWVLNAEWNKTQLLELECDLIASYLEATGKVPAAQFGGSKVNEEMV